MINTWSQEIYIYKYIICLFCQIAYVRNCMPPLFFLWRRLVSWLVCVSCTCKATGWRCCPPLSAPWTSSAPAPSSSWTTTPGYRPSRTSSCSGSHMSSSTSGQVPGTFNFCYTIPVTFIWSCVASPIFCSVSAEIWEPPFLKAAPAAYFRQANKNALFLYLAWIQSNIQR